MSTQKYVRIKQGELSKSKRRFWWSWTDLNCTLNINVNVNTAKQRKAFTTTAAIAKATTIIDDSFNRKRNIRSGRLKVSLSLLVLLFSAVCHFLLNFVTHANTHLGNFRSTIFRIFWNVLFFQKNFQLHILWL